MAANEAIRAAAAALGRRGGAVGSEKQKAAARENGKKGGRPKASQRDPVLRTMWLDGMNVHYLEGTAPLVRAIWKAADDEDILQSNQMAELFPDEPTRHTTTRLGTALRYIGAVTEFGPDIDD